MTSSSSTSLVAIASQAAAAPRLLALPHLYDVSSSTLWDHYRVIPEAKNSGLMQALDPGYQTLTKRTVANDAKVAFQLAAPIGLNIVRLAALGSFVVAASPVALALGGAGILLTGKKTLEDLKRALTSDPQIRGYLQAAEDALAQGNLEVAEQCLKDALGVDVSPDNPRNGDIYLQFGMLYVRMQRPRQALLAFARASVLFRENQFLVLPGSDGQAAIKVSKRGYTELMALNCLNAFALDDAGLAEWAALAKDFGQSAALRLENFATAKEEGALFSLFGVDEVSARYNRSLLGGIKFLQAKFAAAQALEHSGENLARPSIEAGLALVQEDESLSQNEKGRLILQQSQFYFAMARRHPDQAVTYLDTALELSRKGSELLDDIGDVLQVRAEVMAWLVHSLPSLSQQFPDAVAQRLSGYRSEWQHLIAQVEQSSIPGREEFLLWACDQLYRSSASRDDRRRAVQQGLAVTERLGDAASAVHYALRLAYVDPSPAAAQTLLDAARTLASHRDPLLRSYGKRYLASLITASDSAAAQDLYADAADAAHVACIDIREYGRSVPFMLQGRPVIHAARDARVVLEIHVAYCLFEAKRWEALAQCLARLERDPEIVGQPLALLVLDALRAHLAIQKHDSIYARHLRDKVLAAAPPEMRAELTKLLPTMDAATERQVLSPTTEDGMAPLPRSEIERFEASRGQLQELIAAVEQLLMSAEYGESTLAVLGEQRQRLQNAEFRVAIVGEFSTGKSTFLNALLGARVLPSAVRPTTAIINRLAFGTPGLRIFFQDGHEAQAPLEALKDYITEKANPANTKGISSVEIRAQVPLLKAGVTLIDTPGVGSLFSSHTETTLQLLPTCDAVILITDATQPLAQSEREFLDQLKGVMSERIFVVANKVDDLTPPQAARAISFLEENLRPLLPAAKVYPVSAYLALAARRLASGELTLADVVDDPFLQGAQDPVKILEASRFDRLEAGLYRELIQRKGDLLLHTSRDRLRDVLMEVDADLEMRLRNLDRDMSDVNERVEAVVAAIRLARQRLVRIFDQFDAGQREVKTELWERLRSDKRRVLTRLRETVEALDYEQLQNPAAMAGLNEHVRDWLDEAVAEGVKHLQQQFDRALRAVAEVSAELGAAFSHQMASPAPAWKSPLQTALAPYASASDDDGDWVLMSGGLGFVGGLMLGPLGVAAAVIGGYFFGRLREERQTEAARQQVMTQVGVALDQAEASFRQQVDSILATTFTPHIEHLRHAAEQSLSVMEERLAGMMAERQVALTDLTPVRERLLRTQVALQSHLENLNGEMA